MSEVQPFTFPETGQRVRTVMIDGEPWFVLADVAKILGYRDAEHAGRLCRDAQLNTLPQGIAAELGQRGGRLPKIVTEGGLYRLVMRSNVALAEPFQDWVTDDVLPAIRRTGSYSVAPAPRLPDITTPEGVLAMAEQFADTARALVAADQKIKELEPKALAHDRYLTADKGDRLVREVAKLLGWKERDLRAFLLDEGLIFRKQALCGTHQYDVYAAHARHFRPVEKVVEHTWGPCSHYTLYVRPSGVDLIQRRIERQRAAIQHSIGET
ncbi:phage antirepressor [Actinomadura sp. SCN-SB]|uniref:phage antirepressor n=1 Tax=Actinomadura sp. SCN-SB TaxID=3373092 RepID=UPI0037521376